MGWNWRIFKSLLPVIVLFAVEMACALLYAITQAH